MKEFKIKVITTGLQCLLLTLLLAAAFPLNSFAEENASIAVREKTEVDVVYSVEDLAAESTAAENNPFFTIDASRKTTNHTLADEETDAEVSDILADDISTDSKQEAIADTLDESGMYLAKEGNGSKVEITSLFAHQRLRLNAAYTDNLQAYGATKAVYYDGYYLLSYESEEDTKLAYEELSKEYGADAVIVDVPLKTEKIYGWGTAHMGLDNKPALYPVTAGVADSSSVTVAVLDTGIDRNHIIFNDDRILDGFDFANADSNPKDDQGHGTAVSGIIAESTYFNVNILPVKVLDNKGQGSLVSILMGIDYAEKNGADIINLSLGGYIDNKSDFQYLNHILKDVKPLLVCAAGNDSIDMDEEGVYEFPGEISNFVCVSAISKNNNLCSFSNYGNAVDFSAPGMNINLAKNGGGFMYASGTSFSTPYISAAAARVKSENQNYNNNAIVNNLRSRCIDLGAAGVDRKFGYGYPSFAAATAEKTVSRIDISPVAGNDNEIQIAGIKNKVTYTGSAITQKPKLIVQGKTLVKGVDYDLTYKNNVNAGTAKVTFVGKGDYIGSRSVSFTIAKAANTIKTKAVKKTLKHSSLKKKNAVLGIGSLVKITKPKGKLTYTKLSGSKRISVNKKTGRITVKKGSKRGTYKIRIKVSAAGTSNYLSGAGTVTATVVVK